MSGARDASHTWQDHHIERLRANEFCVGAASPALRYHEERSIRLLVHGDGFALMTDQASIDYVRKILGDV